MEKMPGHTNLYRRGATYYFRAAVPTAMRESYGRAEVKISLKTKDRKEAIRLVKLKAAEVQREFDEHRLEQEQLARLEKAPMLDELSDRQIEQLAELHYALILEEDDDRRLDGFDNDPELRPTIVLEPGTPSGVIDSITRTLLKQKPHFDQSAAELEELIKDLRANHGRGIILDDDFFDAEELLKCEGIKLNPKSSSLKKLALELQRATIDAFEVKHQRMQGATIKTPKLAGNQIAPVSGAPLLSEVVNEWATEKSSTTWSAKTADARKAGLRDFIEVVGDKPLGQYKKADGREFKAVLMKLPANWRKKKGLNHLDIVRAADKAAKQGMKLMADGTLNDQLSYVTSLWNYAAAHYDECPPSPVAGLKISNNRDPRDDRNPFTLHELQAIFEAPIYTGCKSLRFCNRPGDLIPKDQGIFWVPLIGLLTGARLGEIIQFYTDDIRRENDMWYFDINRGAEDKGTKNLVSIRRIPIHHALVEIGLLDFVGTRMAQGAQRLFPELKPDKYGNWSGPFSKKFSRFLAATGVKTPRNSFHSFRHNYEDACRDSKIPGNVMDALQGHGETGMSRRYGSGFSLRRLAEEMAKLKYRGLDLAHLKEAT